MKSGRTLKRRSKPRHKRVTKHVRKSAATAAAASATRRTRRIRKSGGKGGTRRWWPFGKNNQQVAPLETTSDVTTSTKTQKPQNVFTRLISNFKPRRSKTSVVTGDLSPVLSPVLSSIPNLADTQQPPNMASSSSRRRSSLSSVSPAAEVVLSSSPQPEMNSAKTLKNVSVYYFDIKIIEIILIYFISFCSLSMNEDKVLTKQNYIRITNNFDNALKSTLSREDRQDRQRQDRQRQDRQRPDKINKLLISIDDLLEYFKINNVASNYIECVYTSLVNSNLLKNQTNLYLMSTEDIDKKTDLVRVLTDMKTFLEKI